MSAWTEPYTLKERLSIRYDLKRYDIKRFFEAGMWQSLARKVPRRLAYFCAIRVWAEAAAGNEVPTGLAMATCVQRWGDPRCVIGTLNKTTTTHDMIQEN